MRSNSSMKIGAPLALEAELDARDAGHRVAAADSTIVGGLRVGVGDCTVVGDLLVFG